MAAMHNDCNEQNGRASEATAVCVSGAGPSENQGLSQLQAPVHDGQLQRIEVPAVGGIARLRSRLIATTQPNTGRNAHRTHGRHVRKHYVRVCGKMAGAARNPRAVT